MLSATDVHAAYGEVRVLDGVSIAVPAGRVVALLGANGAGKTTLLRSLSGLLAPTSGTVTVDGTDLTGRAPHAHTAVGVCLVPEGRAVFRRLTVRQNLHLQAGPGDRAAAVDVAVAAFPRLGERLDQIAGTMSGGEQQMLALARSLVCDPRYVLLDEVSMGLAPVIVDEIFEFIAVLATRGAGLLLVEQYVERALAVADIVYVLDRGRLVFSGQTCEVDEADLLARYLGTHDEKDSR